MRTLLAILMLLAAMLATPSVAEAGRRCGRCGRVVTHVYSHGGGYSCDSCYKKQEPAKEIGWRAGLAALLKFEQDIAAYETGKRQLAAGSGAGGSYASAYAGVGGAGYGQGVTTFGEYSSYPVQGNTLLGVNAYSTHPLVDLNATLNLQGKLASQLAQGAHASAADTADLASTVYTLENDRQAKIAAFSAVQAIAQGAPAQPTVNTFRFQQTTQPAGPSGGSPGQVSASATVGPLASAGPTLEAVIANRCASCHTGAEAAGGLNMADFGLAELEAMVERVNLSPDDPKFMPQVKTDGGHGPGTPLTWMERHALEAALLSAKAQPQQ